ncbi:MAG TPA: Sec-independent protein translocase protein TatB [Thiobacillaceae bacterium]|nr:Sec-independent protein translocase protein TatB [Thiobacillaceae bacterium]
MFDIGFSELLLIGVVALIVIGPERLPKVARTAGHLFGRFQRYVSSVKADISREMELDELRKAGQAFKESVESSARNLEGKARDAEYSIRDEVVAKEKMITAVGQEPQLGSDAQPAKAGEEVLNEGPFSLGGHSKPATATSSEQPTPESSRQDKA